LPSQTLQPDHLSSCTQKEHTPRDQRCTRLEERQLADE